MPMSSVTPYMNVARIARTHGKRGEVVVIPVDGLPFCLEEGMRVCLTPPDLYGDRFRTVVSVGVGETPLVRFSGVDGLNDAEGLVGKLVLARRDEVPQAVRERAVLDCVGCRVVDERHGELGEVVEVMHLPAHDVWRVEGGRYGEVLVPVVDEMVESLPDGPDDVVRVRLIDGLVDLAGE